MTKKADIIPAISSGPFRATPTGLVISEASSIDIETWQQYGADLRHIQGALRWCIGDWLGYGERTYGEMYTQALDLWPEYSIGSLQKCKYVSGAIQIDERRPDVTWSAHADVAKLPPAARSKWLDKLEGGMTREDLRLALNGHGPTEKHACPECGAVHKKL